MKFIVRRTAVMAVWLLLLSGVFASAAAGAASPELTASQKAAFDRTVSAADAEKSAKLQQQYRDYEALRQQAKDREQKIADLHFRNEESLVLLRKKIKAIDSERVARTKQTYEGTKERYKKLFDLYRSVNLQLEAARKLKNKTVTAVLHAEADSLKIPVQLARHDIGLKEAEYEAAKKNASAKMKRVRDTLEGITPVQVQIRAAKSALSGPRDSRWTVWKAFTQSLSKRDAAAASSMLGSVNGLSRQFADRLQKIFALETRIADIIRLAEAQLAQSGSS